MSVVYIALPIALLLALAGVIAFIWAVRSGQLDDVETPSLADPRRRRRSTPTPPESKIEE